MPLWVLLEDAVALARPFFGSDAEEKIRVLLCRGEIEAQAEIIREYTIIVFEWNLPRQDPTHSIGDPLIRLQSMKTSPTRSGRRQAESCSAAETWRGFGHYRKCRNGPRCFRRRGPTKNVGGRPAKYD
jgi:hypothetical protein